MSPFPQTRLVWERTSYVLGHPKFWAPLKIPLGGALAAPHYTIVINNPRCEEKSGKLGL